MNQINWAKPRIAIVGSGAIGGYYGAKLARAGCDVHFLLRADYDAVKARGLSIHDGPDSFDWPDVQAHTSTGEIGPCDLVIVALKATANSALPELLPPLLHSQTALLTLQNGLGNEEFLAEQFGAQRVLGGVLFRLPPSHRARHDSQYGARQHRVGRVGPRAPARAPSPSPNCSNGAASNAWSAMICARRFGINWSGTSRSTA